MGAFAFRAALVVLALMGAATNRVKAQGGRQFDGTWQVLFTCPATADGVRGYNLRYVASVQNGTLHGEKGVQGQEGYLALDGIIQPDGNAMLLATGLTADSAYSLGHVRPLSRVRYTIDARFQGTRGTGKRVEQRPCEAVFTKQ